ncbi:hypothetical protein ABT160_43120 [Streptomyces sp. NPDC001941]|uniref:hypothetical protein n=1 Tax=Streptomyces sp. NPDC001941 TaxID=3154659 RepID=UPI00332EE13E
MNSEARHARDDDDDRHMVRTFSAFGLSCMTLFVGLVGPSATRVVLPDGVAATSLSLPDVDPWEPTA